MVRLNILENWGINAPEGNAVLKGNASLHIHYVDIPGSISFNNLAMLISASGTTAKTLSVSFGLYSLNGATLSLANSASMSTNPATNAHSWITFVTSATQDITPGQWFFAVMSSTAGTNLMSLRLVRPALGNDFPSGGNGGPFFGGVFSVSTEALPASIATTDMIKEGAATLTTLQPYVLLGA